jgi:hypothetical protein
MTHPRLHANSCVSLLSLLDAMGPLYQLKNVRIEHPLHCVKWYLPWTARALESKSNEWSETVAQGLESESNDSSETFVTTCMSKECDAAHNFFINGTKVDASSALENVNCMASSCKSFENGINRPSNDLVTVPASDPSDCCDACHKVAGCTLFSWGSNERLCYLKHSQGTAVSHQNDITGYI